MTSVLRIASVIWAICISKEVNSVAINNGIVGVPEIQCMEELIMFSFKTQSPFNGRVYVKGRSDESKCLQSFPSNGAPSGSFAVRLTECGMRRFRSMSPEGMYMMITIVVGFHTIFVTKVDRAYRLQCLFRNPQVTVTRSLDVSMINTTPLGADAAEAKCTYEIRRGGVDGPPLRYAVIGEKSVHVWECAMGEDMRNYGILIYDCVASDIGAKKMVRIVDTKGCIVDPILLGQITYDPDKSRAYAQTHVYKYADKAAIYFQCNIKLCSKKQGDCSDLTPPTCPKLSRRGKFTRSRNRAALNLRKRSINQYDFNSEDGITVGSDEVMVLDAFFDKTKLGHMVRGENATDKRAMSDGRRSLLDIVDLMTEASGGRSGSGSRGICVPPAMYNVMVCSTLFAFILCSISVIVIFVKIIVRVWTQKTKTEPSNIQKTGQWSLPFRWGNWGPWSYGQQQQQQQQQSQMAMTTADPFNEWMTTQFRQNMTKL